MLDLSDAIDDQAPRPVLLDEREALGERLIGVDIARWEVAQREIARLDDSTDIEPDACRPRIEGGRRLVERDEDRLLAGACSCGREVQRRERLANTGGARE